MPKLPGGVEKAPWVGAFFLLGIWVQAACAASCAPVGNAEPVHIRYVLDGDTLILRDQRKVRLIGINTPEMGREGEPTQPLAIEARNRLRQLLFQSSQKAQMLPGKEPRDRHGRILANLWLPDGENLTARLLREGLGWALMIPPNTRLLACYQEAEQSARDAGRGVWKHPAYTAKASKDLNLRSTGFQRVYGRVMRVHRGGGALWIHLEGRFALRIPEPDLRWFPRPPDRSWVGRDVEVRGWLYAAKGETRVNVHHPAALQISGQSAP